MKKRLLLLSGGLLLCLPLCGCMVVGYSSRSGGFIFPGGIGLLVLLAVVYLLVRRR